MDRLMVGNEVLGQRNEISWVVSRDDRYTVDTERKVSAGYGTTGALGQIQIPSERQGALQTIAYDVILKQIG